VPITTKETTMVRPKSVYPQGQTKRVAAEVGMPIYKAIQAEAKKEKITMAEVIRRLIERGL
jgi:hypothetical protein